MKFKILILSLTFFSSFSFSATVIDVKKIVGKTQMEVFNVLGKPTNCFKSKNGPKCSYSVGEIEIVFINGKADWITIEGIDNIPFNSKALESIGIPPIKPSFENNFTIRWSSIQGLREVSIFKGAKNSDYAYIKAFTK